MSSRVNSKKGRESGVRSESAEGETDRVTDRVEALGKVDGS